MYMQCLKLILASVFTLLLQGTVSAQIYESEDARGVPEFSDTPTPGAELVDLPSTNIAEPPPEGQVTVPTIQEPSKQGGEAAAGNKQAEGASVDTYYGGDGEDENVRARRRLEEDRIDNTLPGNRAPGVGEASPEIEPRAAEKRDAQVGRQKGVGAPSHGAGGRR